MIHPNDKVQIRAHRRIQRVIFLVLPDGTTCSYIEAQSVLGGAIGTWENLLKGNWSITSEPSCVGELICYLTKDGIESVTCMGQEPTRVSFKELRGYYERSYCDG